MSQPPTGSLGNRPDPDPVAFRPARPPRVALAVALAILIAAAWLLVRLYTNSAVDECRALYRAARTAADTAAVDRIVPKGAEGRQTPGSCGFMRGSGRWQ